MADVTFDVLLNIVRPWISNQTGHRSKYSSDNAIKFVHPGTGNLIEGWKWGEFTFPDYAELSDFSYIPVLFDSDINIDSLYYQSGYIFDNDIKLNSIESELIENKKHWIPKIHSGGYYIYNQEWHLFSDEYISERLSLASNLHTLGYEPKELTPIFIRSFKREDTFSHIAINKDIKKKTSSDSDFNIEDPGDDEFIIVGNEGKLKVGTITGMGSQSESFPIESTTSVLELSLFPIASISSVSVGSISDWTLDSDLGLLKRDSPSTDGLDNSTLIVVYVPDLVVQYEPLFSSDEVSGGNANINPLHIGTNKGFVQVTTDKLEPFKVSLISDLTDLNSDVDIFDYELEVGNNTTKLSAVVEDKYGEVLDEVKVYFDWQTQGNTYGELTVEDPSFITDVDGSAYTFFTTPGTVDGMGAYIEKSDITTVGSTSSFTIEGLELVDITVNEVSTYEIFHDDLFFGLSSADVGAYYTNYLTEEEITDTTTANQAYEEKYRLARNFDLNSSEVIPKTLASTDTRGKRQLVLEQSSASKYLHPSNGLRAGSGNLVYVPLRPTLITPSQSVTDGYELDYNVDLKTSNKAYQYFVVAPRKVKFQAHVYNSSGQKVSSNEITIKITLPDSVNGVYYTSALNNMPAGFNTDLLRGPSPFPNGLNGVINLQNFETELDPVRYTAQTGYDEDDLAFNTTSEPATQNTFGASSLSTEAYIPLGFRIKGDGIEVGSLLDQATFITKNS